MIVHCILNNSKQYGLARINSYYEIIIISIIDQPPRF
jgi:hypothetical protein